jgi:hypothetical protein
VNPAYTSTAGLADLAAWQYEQYCAILADWCREAATAGGETCAVSFDALARVLLAALDGWSCSNSPTQTPNAPAATSTT